MRKKITKVHNPIAIANRFVEKAAQEGKQLDIVQLVKLVYLAHGWCLGITGSPLISSRVEAWKYGPVVPEVYRAFRPQGVVILARAMNFWGNPHDAELDEEQAEIVDMVYDLYSPLSALALSARTHATGTPWAQTQAETGKRPYAPIPNDRIRTYYRRLIDKSKAA